MTLFTRRAAIATAASAPLALSSAGFVRAASHAGTGAPLPKARSFALGELQVTTLLAGTVSRDEPQTIFGMNVSAEEFAAVSAENFIGIERAQFFFTPTVVRDGTNTMLFDTGLNAAATTEALGEAGIAPQDVTHVVITHMHGDHIGGMTGDDGTKTFGNAALITGQAEFDHWSGAENDGFKAKIAPFAEEFAFVNDGDSIAPGITAMAAFGHTPGHMTYMLESNGQQLLLIADMANHYVWSLGYPDWEVRFDMDKAAAAATRRRVLGMLAADKIPMIGYHMPFPAVGYVAPRDDGFRYVPVSYQFM